jgi:hypothetical protein
MAMFLISAALSVVGLSAFCIGGLGLVAPYELWAMLAGGCALASGIIVQNDGRGLDRPVQAEKTFEMSYVKPQSPKLNEVVNLAAALAEQMMASRLQGYPIPPEQVRALVNAARCLTDNHISWPPSVQKIVRELAERMEAAEPIPESRARLYPASHG